MNLRKPIAFIQIVFMVFLNVWNVRIVLADDSDIFGNNIAPNVMILLDSSQSMDDEVGTLIAYNPNQSPTYASVTYRGSHYRRHDRLQQKDQWERSGGTVAAVQILVTRFMQQIVS